jgi:hypothetical protein
MMEFFVGVIVGALGVFAALWFDIGMDWLEDRMR